MDINKIYKLTIAFLGTALTWLFGTWDIAIAVLILFMTLDFITGIMKGYKKKELSSKTGAEGIFGKINILFMLIIAVALDRLLNQGTWVFRTVVCYFYIATEGLSLLENCASMGLPVPEKLRDTLIQLKKGGRKEIKVIK